MDYRYVLTEDEYITFCKNSLYEEKRIRLIRWSLFLAVPGLLLILAFVFRPTRISLWVAGILLTLIWLYLSGRLFSALMTVAVKNQIKKSPEPLTFKKMEVAENDKGLFINHKREKIAGFRFFPDLLILELQDSSQVIIPQRVFADTDEMKQFISAAVQISKGTSGAGKEIKEGSN